MNYARYLDGCDFCKAKIILFLMCFLDFSGF